MLTRLNVGCGTDYREGHINIDGSSSIFKVDKYINLNEESLLSHFQPNTVDFILANDVVEHFFHWEAISLVQDFYSLLKPFGKVEIRVPDAEYIIDAKLSIAQKLNLLFGGQDIPQGIDVKMDESRRNFPLFFCHKYGWTRAMMESELKNIGFSNVVTKRAGTNFVASAERLK
jgi:hypothetical protein